MTLAGGSDVKLEGIVWGGGTSTDTSPTHTYASAGERTVTLTVTDNDGALDTATGTATPTSGVPGGGIALSVTPFKVRGIQMADLAWTEASFSPRTSAGTPPARPGPAAAPRP